MKKLLVILIVLCVIGYGGFYLFPKYFASNPVKDLKDYIVNTVNKSVDTENNTSTNTSKSTEKPKSSSRSKRIQAPRRTSSSEKSKAGNPVDIKQKDLIIAAWEDVYKQLDPLPGLEILSAQAEPTEKSQRAQFDSIKKESQIRQRQFDKMLESGTLFNAVKAGEDFLNTERRYFTRDQINSLEFQIGELYLKMGRYYKAAEKFKNVVLSTNDETFKISAEFGYICMEELQTNNHNEAVKSYNDLLKNCDNDFFREKIKSRLNDLNAN